MNFESELAESVFKSKYLLEGETTAEEAVERIVKSVAKVYPEIEEEAREYINKQWFIPAGGIWRAAGNPNKNVSHVNCTTLKPPEDNLEDIFDSLYKWAKYAAFGQGEGIDISNLRPKNSKVHNSSRTSTGAVSFMALYDSILKVIAQQGRRGASLISIRDSHPDVEDFITIKDGNGKIETANISIQTTDAFMNAVKNDDEWLLHYENKYETIEKKIKARDLFNKICNHAWAKAEPGLQFIDIAKRNSNSDALGENIVSTNACCFTGDTLIATKEGLFPIKDLVNKEIEIFDSKDWIKVNTFKSYGEDDIYRVILNNGAHFDVTKNHRFFLENGKEVKTFELQIGDKLEKVKNASLISSIFERYIQNIIISIEPLNKKEEVFCCTVPTTGKFLINSGIITGNSEQWLDPENVCNLSHINLAKFFEYGEETYIRIIKFGIKFLNAVRINEYNENRSPIKEQHEKLMKVPRVGLGYTGLADYLLDKKIAYGSEKSIEEVKYITSTLAKYAIKTSYELGKQYGSFTGYNKEKFITSGYIKRLLENNIIEENDLDYQFNVALTTLAPVGTGSIISNVGGSGIEPLFSKYYVRRERATTKEWKEWFSFNAYVERYLKKKGLEITKENADKLTEPWWVMSYDVNPLDKIKLVAEAQKYIDSSISVTFNMPEEATVEDVKNVYMSAWEHELKGVTVYREGSLGGVLITEKTYNKQEKVTKKEIGRDATYERRPDILNCDIYEAKYKENKFIVLIGLKENEPYEVFITPNDDSSIDVEKFKKGKIIKVKSGQYDLIVENGITKTMINDIGKRFDSMYGTLSRMISMSLRHKVPLQFIVDQLNKDSGFIAFEKVLSRILKKYIRDNTSARKKCPHCGSELIYQDGCISCSNKECSFSKCD